MSLLVDNRSAGMSRSTGWERYGRSIRDVLKTQAEVDGFDRTPANLPAQLIADYIDLPLKARSYDFVHFPSFPPGPIFPVRKSVVTVHDLTWWREPSHSSFLGRTYYFANMRRAVKDCAALVTVSKAMQVDMQEYFGRAVAVVPNRVMLDTVPSDAKLAIRRERPYLVSIGSVEPRKNLPRLARAFEASGLGETHDMVLVGRSAWGQLPSGIDHVGVVTDSELRGLIEGSLGVVSASLYEGFGLPVAEAVAVGAPVACSDITAHHEAAGNGAAIYFDPFSEDSISGALLSLAQGKAPRRPPSNPFDSNGVLTALREVYAPLGVDL